MTKSPDFPVLKALFASLAVGLLSGCASNFAPGPIQPHETPIGNIQGAVHGGQAPVTGASIYLYAAGTGGYGTPATSLIKSASNSFPDGTGKFFVKTDSSGNFSLGGDYTCTEGTQIYMVALGGNPGVGAGTNSSIVQMAGLGECPSAGNLAAQVPYLVINEVTTVAFAYSMSGFATTPFNVSSNAANSTASATAIANAMANTLNIVNIQYGQAPAATNGNSKSTNPVSKIYALANILAACVNSVGPGTGTACNALFAAAKDSSGNNATDEGSAIFNIAHNQGQNVAAIWKVYAGNSVFSPMLPSQPADWTIPIVYKNVLSQFGTNGANQVTSGAYNIAFDDTGTAWIGDRVKGLVEMSPLGAVQTFTNANFGMIKGVAVTPDSSAIWVADFQKNQVDIMSPAGAITQTLTSNISGPSAVAFDSSGAGFVVNEANGSVTAFTSSGGFPVNTGAIGVDTPAWISIDQNGNAWIPSTDTAEVGQAPFTINPGNGKVKFGNVTTMGADDSYGLAIDSSNNAWFATNTITGNGNPGTEHLEDVVRTVTTGRNGKQTITYGIDQSITGTGNNGGGLGLPYKISVDGNNNIWMANEAFQTVSEYSTTLGKWLGVAQTGFNNGSTGTTLSATPDNSGNLWTANTDGSVTVLLGVATPTANPIFPGDFGTLP